MCITRWLTSSSVPSSHNECACKKVRTIHSPLATGVRRGLPVERESPCFARFACSPNSFPASLQVDTSDKVKVVVRTVQALGDTGCCFEGVTSSSQGTGWSAKVFLPKPQLPVGDRRQFVGAQTTSSAICPSRYKCALASIEGCA